MFSGRLCSLCSRSCRQIPVLKSIHSGQLALCFKSQYSLDKLYPRRSESAIDNNINVGVGLKVRYHSTISRNYWVCLPTCIQVGIQGNTLRDSVNIK